MYPLKPQKGFSGIVMILLVSCEVRGFIPKCSKVDYNFYNGSKESLTNSYLDDAQGTGDNMVSLTEKCGSLEEKFDQQHRSSASSKHEQRREYERISDRFEAARFLNKPGDDSRIRSHLENRNFRMGIRRMLVVERREGRLHRFGNDQRQRENVRIRSRRSTDNERSELRITDLRRSHSGETGRISESKNPISSRVRRVQLHRNKQMERKDQTIYRNRVSRFEYDHGDRVFQESSSRRKLPSSSLSYDRDMANRMSTERNTLRDTRSLNDKRMLKGSSSNRNLAKRTRNTNSEISRVQRDREFERLNSRVHKVQNNIAQDLNTRNSGNPLDDARNRNIRRVSVRKLENLEDIRGTDGRRFRVNVGRDSDVRHERRILLDTNKIVGTLRIKEDRNIRQGKSLEGLRSTNDRRMSRNTERASDLRVSDRRNRIYENSRLFRNSNEKLSTPEGFRSGNLEDHRKLREESRRSFDMSFNRRTRSIHRRFANLKSSKLDRMTRGNVEDFQRRNTRRITRHLDNPAAVTDITKQMRIKIFRDDNLQNISIDRKQRNEFLERTIRTSGNNDLVQNRRNIRDENENRRVVKGDYKKESSGSDYMEISNRVLPRNSRGHIKDNLHKVIIDKEEMYQRRIMNGGHISKLMEIDHKQNVVDQEISDIAPWFRTVQISFAAVVLVQLLFFTGENEKNRVFSIGQLRKLKSF